MSTSNRQVVKQLAASPARNGRAPVPAPAAADPPVGWDGPPAPLPELPPVPPFPLHLLPARVGRLYAAGAAAMNVPVDFLAGPGLALLGAAVGRSVAARHSRTWQECPALWVAVVGIPGAGKSGSLSKAAAPLRAAERRWLQAHEAVALAHLGEEERSGLAFKEWKAAGCVGDPPPKPVRPALRQVVLDKFTGEALGRVLLANPRGLVVCKDELSGLVAALDMYRGKGDDKQNLLSAWAGALFKVNLSRDADAPPLQVPHPFLGVAGMLTPQSLAGIRGDDRKGRPAGDGWADRFLWCYPDPLPAVGETWPEVPEEAERGYAELVDALLAVDMQTGEQGPHPRGVPFDAGGRTAWEGFTAGLAARTNRLATDDPFRGVLAKLKGYGLRLSALLWCLRRAAGEIERDDPIGGDVVAAAAGLVGYFEAHARRCWGVGTDDATARVARRLLGWLAREPGLTQFTRSQAFQRVKDGRDVRAGEALNAPLALLADHGFVRQVAGDAGRPGPVPQVFTVNPLWDRAGDGQPDHHGDDHHEQAAERGDAAEW